MATPVRAILAFQDETTARVFRLISDNQTMSGWNVAKALNLRPNDAEDKLKALTTLGVISSDGTGLDGYYFLTGYGLQIRSELKP